MSHEVIKRVGARAYRYRVESYRDASSKKVRSRWTYLGRVDPSNADGRTSVPPRTRRRTTATRERLIEALESVLETVTFDRVTAGAVAKRAGVAHGTFYRYFADKRALLHAALDRLRDEFERTMPSFEAPYGDENVERERLCRWVTAILGKPAGHAGLLRAFFDALESDPELRERRSQRQERRIASLAAYFMELEAAGIVRIPHPEALAIALLALVDTTIRTGIVAGAASGARIAVGVSDVFERAIFGVALPPRC